MSIAHITPHFSWLSGERTATTSLATGASFVIAADVVVAAAAERIGSMASIQSGLPAVGARQSPDARMMLSGVLRVGREQLEVRGGVVQLALVLVVNDLAAKKAAPKNVLHHESVNELVASAPLARFWWETGFPVSIGHVQRALWPGRTARAEPLEGLRHSARGYPEGVAYQLERGARLSQALGRGDRACGEHLPLVERHPA